MARIQNKRIKTKYENNTPEKRYVKPTIDSIKSTIKNISKPVKIFVLSLIVFNIISMILLGILTSGIAQSIFMVALFAVNIIASAIFSIWNKPKKLNFLCSCISFFLILTIISSSFLLYGELGIDKAFAVNKEISEVTSNSTKILSTDMVDIYVNLDKMEAYSVSNIAGQKYVNTNKFSIAEESEYYFLYNVGIQLNSPTASITEMFVYPPTPHTTTGYEYLLEIKYNNQLYVTKVFLPGYLNLENNVSSQMFVLTYTSSQEKFYVVNRVDDYFVFQSDYSTFSTPYENVKYTSDQEFFYVRYNRYLSEYMDGEDYEEIGEENVRFAKTLVTLSTKIKKINFFWIGYTANEQFIASTPVMEIVYEDDTCDIAIIKDITPDDLANAIT